MYNLIKFPLYAKFTAIIICFIGIFSIVYLGQDIIFPLLLALVFAILLRPIVAFLNRRLRLPHFIAVVLAITLFVLLFLGVFYFISIQVSEMASDWGKIKNNFFYHLEHFQRIIRDNLNISKSEQKEFISKAQSDSLATSKSIVGSTITSFTDIVLNLTLIPIYTFLFLLYQNMFINFLAKLFKPENHDKLRQILVQIKVAVQSYILGLLFEMIAVSVLTTLGLYLIGVEYFILLGIITGILNLIPYIGILFAGALSIVISLSGSTDLSLVLGVIIVNIVVQFIDNNILVPLFVNSKVQINAMASIVGIIIGNVLGGITGMFLAIPIIAIIKVICDNIEALHAWGYVLGDDLPKTYQWHNIKIPHYNYNQSINEINFNSESNLSENKDVDHKNPDNTYNKE